jgi:hypothetical protein
MSNPTITPGYGFVPCSHDDPKRSHYWANTTTKWRPESDCMNFNPCPSCSKANWRKPVEIPDGWELVPEGEKDTADMKFWGREMNPGWNENHDPVNIQCGRYPFVAAFIRRKPAQPTVEPSKPAVDWSKPLQLKDGRKARFLALIECPDRPRCCVVTDADGDEWVDAWCENGNFTMPRSSPLEISRLDIINTPERIKREVWLNVYESGGITPWADKDTADTHALEGRIACVRVQIDCEKGEGL